MNHRERWLAKHRELQAAGKLGHSSATKKVATKDIVEAIKIQPRKPRAQRIALSAPAELIVESSIKLSLMNRYSMDAHQVSLLGETEYKKFEELDDIRSFFEHSLFLSKAACITATQLCQRCLNGKIKPAQVFSRPRSGMAIAKSLWSIETPATASTEVFLRFKFSQQALEWIIEDLTGNEEKVWLRKLLRTWQEVKDHIVLANLRLVMYFAKRYIGRKASLAYLDLIQLGNIGLVKAVDRFDHRRGYRFATYAKWWILDEIWKGLAKLGDEIRVPKMKRRLYGQYSKAVQDLEQKFERRPSDEEIATQLECDIEQLDFIRRLAHLNPRSLNEPVGDDNETEFGQLVADQSVVSSSDVAQVSQTTEKVRAVLSTLKYRESRVLELRFGIAGRRYTLDEIASDVFPRDPKIGRKITRERVRQIEAKALLNFEKRVKRLGLRSFMIEAIHEP